MMERILIWLGTTLLVTGAVMIGIGLLFGALAGRGVRMLPGDIVISRPGFTFVFPIVTSLVLSVVLTLVVWMIAALRR